jgi:hypothetical protein
MDNYIKLDENIFLKILNPHKKHIIINSDYAKRYMGYLLILEDLKSILLALDELKKEWSKNIIRESLSFYIVITYGKVFAKADVRKVKLDRKHLEKIRKDLIILHDILIDLRNKHVAHAGSEIFSLNNLVAQVEDTSICTYLSGINLSSFNFNIKFIEELVKEVLSICETKSEKAYEILTKNFLTNEDIESKSFLPSDFELYSFQQIKDILTDLTLNYYHKNRENL